MEIEEITQVPLLGPRRPDSNKGDFGKVLVVAGSRGMSGAAVLCGSAALRAGAGLVRVAVPEQIQPIVAMGNPCYTTLGWSQDQDGRFDAAALFELIQAHTDNDVIALGSGLGRGRGLSFLATGCLAKTIRPVVLDADGLNAFVDQPERLHSYQAPLVITPHAGEFARLLGISTKEVQANRRDLAIQFARERELVVVLKGHGTIVTDGRRFYTNTTGNPGMATGGTGDVLTGIIAALIGQQLAPFDAAVMGVCLHGVAGDLARDEVGEVSMTASDLLQHLPGAFRQALR